MREESEQHHRRFHGGEWGHGEHGEHPRPHHHGHESCGCGHGEHHPHHGHGESGCGCGHEGWGPMAFRRRFRTREERIAWLQEYLNELQAEAKAVEERIAELKAAG